MYLIMKAFKGMKIEWIISWLLCSSVTVILSPLFELRYFMIPGVMASLEIETKFNKWHALNIIYFIIVNTAVMWVFVKRPFINEYMENELSRFFW